MQSREGGLESNGPDDRGRPEHPVRTGLIPWRSCEVSLVRISRRFLQERLDLRQVWVLILVSQDTSPSFGWISQRASWISLDHRRSGEYHHRLPSSDAFRPWLLTSSTPRRLSPRVTAAPTASLQRPLLLPSPGSRRPDADVGIRPKWATFGFINVSAILDTRSK
ncbi:hypothetical protein ON010_g7288 [Phytophthora cinnamomi]|nr:hypothetical protein ON010_g7288 [Phytophthora cinnamomi]